jgi:antitoxin component YwqK of YwqJK toxin-antitoxin module
MLADSIFYIGGKRNGISLGWDKDGMLTDSSSFDGAGNGVQVAWYAGGVPRSAGRYIQDTLMTGPWTYFHPTGQKSAVEIYKEGKRQSQQYFTEEGLPISDTTNTDKEGSFTGGLQAWRRYLENNLEPSVPAKKGAPNGTFTVGVQFVINTDGTLEDLKPLTKHGYGMEEEVIRLIKRSPRWQPARQHNRLVKAYRIQPVTFVIDGGR